MKRKVNASVSIIPIVCAMLRTSENTNSETIDVSIYVDTKKNASMVVDPTDTLPYLEI